MSSGINSRYFRQLILPEFGEKKQAKLKNSSVLIAGAGGLGSPAALYLAAAGVGRLIVCDHDKVELSNLNRQILHGTGDIGRNKSESALQSLSDLNNDIQIETHSLTLDQKNIRELAAGVDLMLDCLDNIKTRLVLNAYSIEQNVAIIHAGVDGWTGQLSFLHPPETPCMACLFEEAEDDRGPTPILGAIAGIVGSTQALEAIRYLTGQADTLKNTLLYFDGLNMDWNRVEIRKNLTCKACSQLTPSK